MQVSCGVYPKKAEERVIRKERHYIRQLEQLNKKGYDKPADEQSEETDD
jgi:hypothetical protein